MPNLKRISHLYPQPVLHDTRRTPINWQPSNSIIAEWGTIKVLMNGVDVTNFRGVPCQVVSWSIAEPFGYKTAAIRFPQIHSWEELPSWLEEWASVEIKLVRPDNSEGHLWRGLHASEEDILDDSGSGFTVHCLGALYQADLYLKKPRLGPPVDEDLWTIIQRELNPSSPGDATAPDRSGSRWLAPTGAMTGITFQQQGSWEPLLTGFIADLLGKAVTETGDQWTLDMLPNMTPHLRLKDRTTAHWTFRVGQPGVNLNLSREYVMSPNAFYGDGIDSQQCHWRNTRYPPPGVDPATYPDPPPPPGYTAADVDRSNPPVSVPMFQPVIEDPTTIRWWRTVAEGAIVGQNPAWNNNRVRVESYQNFGSYITREEAGYSAAIEFGRRRPAYTGSITFKADPQEGSRYEISAGHNFMMLGHRNVAGRTIHVSEVSVDFENGTVTCQVDEAARDALTVAAVRNRDRTNTDPSLRPQRTFRNSRAVEDRKSALWDCESGAGRIPATALAGGAWNTVQIPGGTMGMINKTNVTCSPATPFAIGVFDRPPPAMGGVPAADGFWDAFDESTGLIIAWGAGGEFAGYSPGSQGGGDPVTGELRDDASWYYQSEQAPWLWVVVYPGSNCTITGLFRPGANY